MNIDIKLQIIILIAFLQNVGKKFALMIFDFENPKFNMKEKDD